MAGETPNPTIRPTWPVLSANERRILGVLIEKAKTTPDAYPLSLNAVVTGCNQKSNREPLMQINDLDAEDTLAGLQKKGLVTRVTGTRVDRFRHDVYEAWKLDRGDSSLVCELLLRGPRTEGELRSHVSRMQSFDDLDALRAALKLLTERGLVVYLSPQGKRGTTLTHGFHAPEELERLRQRAHSEEVLVPAAPAAVPPFLAEDQRWQEARAAISRCYQELSQLRAAFAELHQTVGVMALRVKALEQGLGI